jgi:hypothetical protein
MVAEGMVLSNQSAFWRRKLHSQIGWMDESLHLGFDFEWFLRLTKHVKRAHSVNQCLGAFRIQPEAKTQMMPSQNIETHHLVRRRYNAYMPGWKIKLYKLKRFTQLALRGEIAYLARGLIHRLKGGGNIY